MTALATPLLVLANPREQVMPSTARDKVDIDRCFWTFTRGWMEMRGLYHASPTMPGREPFMFIRDRFNIKRRAIWAIPLSQAWVYAAPPLGDPVEASLRAMRALHELGHDWDDQKAMIRFVSFVEDHLGDLATMPRDPDPIGEVIGEMTGWINGERVEEEVRQR